MVSVSSAKTEDEKKKSASKKTEQVPPKKLDSETGSHLVLGNPTSINAIFFASILLASRLNKTSKVFTLLYMSLCLFGFIPIIRN
jgi:hypothetical protein